jgi:tRNA A-37 threonylcarbamoyl transferase component Bud32
MHASPAADLEGRLLGGYRLLRRLSASALGEVYLAEQLSLGNRLVAVKIVPTHATPADEADAAEMEERFRYEARVLARFAHPHIVTVHDSGVTDDALYLVMQYVPDGSLADAIHGKGRVRLLLPAAPRLAVALIQQIASALQYTHEHGIIHRDVKASNVLVQVQPDGRWHLLLADFGIARDLQATADLRHVMGTLAYMAPEQFDGRCSAASDQYALGVLTYLLLAGHTPFQGSGIQLMHAHLSATVPDLRQLNPAVSPAMMWVVARALAKDPAARWPSVSAFSEALSEAASTKAGVDSLVRAAPGSVAAALAGDSLGRTRAVPPALVPAATRVAASGLAAAGSPPRVRDREPVTLDPAAVLAGPAPADARMRLAGKPSRHLLTLAAALLLAALTLVVPRLLFSSGLGVAAQPAAPATHQPHVVPTHVSTAGGSLAPGARPTPRPTARPQPSPTPTRAPTATPLPSPTATPSPQPTDTPAATATPTPVVTPPATPITTPVVTPIPTPINTPIATPVATQAAGPPSSDIPPAESPTATPSPTAATGP